MHFQVFFGLSTYSAMFTMTSFESVINLLNMRFQVFFGLAIYSTMFTMKTFEYIMKWLDMCFQLTRQCSQ